MYLIFSYGTGSTCVLTTVTPHPLMACWDEHNARLWEDAYNKDKLNAGVVCLDTFLFTIYIYLI
jgi:hypothetical protein